MICIMAGSASLTSMMLVEKHNGFVNSKCFTLVGGFVVINWLLTVSLVLKKLQTLGKNTSQLISSHTTIHYQNINFFYEHHEYKLAHILLLILRVGTGA